MISIPVASEYAADYRTWISGKADSAEDTTSIALSEQRLRNSFERANYVAGSSSIMSMFRSRSIPAGGAPGFFGLIFPRRGGATLVSH